MHTRQTQNLWLWPKRPPSAFSVAETSVAEMSRPKRPRPKCPWPKCPSTVSRVDPDQTVAHWGFVAFPGYTCFMPSAFCRTTVNVGIYVV